MSQPIKQRLESSLSSATASGRAIASYMLANLYELPFQTAADIAEKLGVSESSVGRFCRAIGYSHFKDLKNDLKNDLGEGPWLVGDRLQEFRQQPNPAAQGLPRSFELEVAALVKVYEYSLTPAWQTVVQRLASRRRVYVAGFQTERGIAASMVHLLQYLRDGVHLVDGAAGHFADVLLSPAEDCALVVFEARRYSRHALTLCHKAREAGIPVTLAPTPSATGPSRTPTRCSACPPNSTCSGSPPRPCCRWCTCWSTRCASTWDPRWKNAWKPPQPCITSLLATHRPPDQNNK